MLFGNMRQTGNYPDLFMHGTATPSGTARRIRTLRRYSFGRHAVHNHVHTMCITKYGIAGGQCGYECTPSPIARTRSARLLGPEFTPTGRANGAVDELAGIRRLEQGAVTALQGNRVKKFVTTG